MKTIIENPGIQNNNRTTFGAIILIIGSILLIDQFNLVFIPDWLFSWPMILIAIGIYSGVKNHFRKPVATILIFLGVAFLCTENIDNADRIVWPIAIIATGTWMVLRNKNHAIDTPFKESSFKEL
ncbi:MAG: LiaF transmembrane domain-containing protein [Mucilaginibacter sp.]